MHGDMLGNKIEIGELLTYAQYHKQMAEGGV